MSVVQAVNTALSAEEESRLKQHEDVIERGLKTFYDVGSALLDIRDSRLYRQQYQTFEAYCEQRWQMSASRARQLIGASETFQQVQSVTTVTLPNERTARALRQFPEDLRPAIARMAAAQAATLDKPLTAGMVERVGEVVTQAATTGAVDFNGRGHALTAALTEAEVWALERQRQHITESMERRAQREVDPETGEISENGSRMKSKVNRAGDEDAPKAYDTCQTPPEALDPLLPYVPREWAIWEPAAGEGLLVEGLYDAGFSSVRGSDILTGQNFFQFVPAVWDCIITNPPYSIKYRWLERCYALGKPFALLLPVETLGAKTAQALFREHGVEVILMDQRVNFKMPYAGWDGSGAQFPVAWFTWGLDIGRALTFARMADYG